MAAKRSQWSNVEDGCLLKFEGDTNTLKLFDKTLEISEVLWKISDALLGRGY